jgi:hypothetical protein
MSAVQERTVVEHQLHQRARHRQNLKFVQRSILPLREASWLLRRRETTGRTHCSIPQRTPA